LAKQFQKRRLLEIGQSETRIVWRPCLSTDRDEMCNLYRRPSKVASFQVAVDLTKQFEKRIFYQICQLETRIVCGDHVCFIWLRRFRGEDFFSKSANQKQESLVATMFVNGSGRNR
jgi:hypothetical protein